MSVETQKEAEVRAQVLLELARQSCAGLREAELDALEATRLDAARFFSHAEILDKERSCMSRKESFELPPEWYWPKRRGKSR